MNHIILALTELFAQAATASEFSAFIGIFSQLGSAGLACLAVWFLTGKHEKAIANLTSSHKEAFEKLAASIDKLGAAQEKREETQLNISVRLSEVASKLETVMVSITEVSHRMESLEKVMIVAEASVAIKRKKENPS